MSVAGVRPLPWHESIAQQWLSRQNGARAPHASLLIVPEGTGGALLLHALAAALLCDTPNTQGFACGVCGSCDLIGAHSHPDVRVLRPSIEDVAHPIEELRPEKPSKDITIDQVRALEHMVNQTSHRGGRRVVLVYPAHTLNRNAANALLKILEEPPAHTVFILLASDVQQLLPTIVSRCQRVAVGAPDAEAALAYLNAIRPNAQWAAWLNQEHGAVLRVAELADTNYFKAQTQWLEVLCVGADLDVVAIATQFEKIIKDADKARLDGAAVSVTMAAVLRWSQRAVCDVVRMAQLDAAMPAQYYPAHQAALSRLSQRIDPIAAHQWHERLGRERRMAEHPLNVRSWLEQLLIDWVRLQRVPES